MSYSLLVNFHWEKPWGPLWERIVSIKGWKSEKRGKAGKAGATYWL
jgi:hypothetical protein